MEFDHPKFRCTNNSRCEKCGDTEHLNDCKSSLKCTNCGSDKHSALDRRCQKYKEIYRNFEKKEVILITNNNEET